MSAIERPRRRAMSKFLRAVVLLSAAAHLVFFVAAQEAARRLRLPAPTLIAALLALGGMSVIFVRARAGMYDRRRSRLFVQLFALPYYVHWCAAFGALVPAVLGCTVIPLIELARGAAVHFPAGWVLGSYVTCLAIAAYGVWIRRQWFVVREVEVTIAGLDARFDGYTIAHLSDLHIGTLTPASMGLRWARAANLRKPDLTVVTGDLVTSGTEFYADIGEVIGDLSAKDGVFVSMGNHDYFGDGEPLIARLRAGGVSVLRNAGQRIERNGAQFWLAAIDDTWTRRDDLDAALEAKPANMPSVLLAHDPARFVQAAAKGVSLTLSGHTHGGQIAMPFLYRKISLSHLAHKFHVGMYKEGNSVLYVHPGLGTTGPPMRLGVAPAVVILRLRAA